MRVLCLGTTGLGKKDILENIADIACKEKFKLSTGFKHENANQYIQIFDIDSIIRDKLIGGYPSFMDAKTRSMHKEVWHKQMEEILEKIESEKPKHVFLSVHGVYYRYNHYFSMIDMNLLAKFRPTIIITLIDDIYNVSEKVTSKEKEYKTNSTCSISEALSWRTIEILMGDNMAENLFINPESVPVSKKELEQLPKISGYFHENIPHFVIAIKHNYGMLYRFLFERKRLRLYSSFPITSTRKEKSKVEEINTFKQRLQENYTVLDPTTIDELLIVKKSKDNAEELGKAKENGMIIKEEDDLVVLKRWSADYSKSSEIPAINIDELNGLKDAIQKQIEKRDYRMVEQSDGVVAYRPFWGSREDPAGGVRAEIQTAIERNKPVHVFHPKDDGEPKLLFTGIDEAIKHDDLKKLFEQLTKLQNSKNKVMADEPNTWE